MDLILKVFSGLILIISTQGLAGEIDSAGGDGLKYQKQVEFLDLAEKQVFSIHTQEAFIDILEPKLKYIEEMYLSYHSQHSDKESKRYFHNSLAAALNRITWVFTNTSLPEINDEGAVYLDQDLANYKVQVAVQKNNMVIINKPYFEQMSKSHQAGLFYHELVLNEILNHSAFVLKDKERGTSKVRDHVQVVMSEDFEFLSPKIFFDSLANAGVYDIFSDTGKRNTFSASTVSLKLEVSEMFDHFIKPMRELADHMRSISYDSRVLSRAEYIENKDRLMQGHKLLMNDTDMLYDLPNNVVEILEYIDVEKVPSNYLSKFESLYNRLIIDQSTNYNRKNIFGRIFSSSKDESKAKKEAALIVLLKYTDETFSNYLEENTAPGFTREFTQQIKYNTLADLVEAIQ